MPQFLIDKLTAQYGQGDPRVYATLNSIGAMRGNRETVKGKRIQAKHEADQKSKRYEGLGKK